MYVYLYIYMYVCSTYAVEYYSVLKMLLKCILSAVAYLAICFWIGHISLSSSSDLENLVQCVSKHRNEYSSWSISSKLSDAIRVLLVSFKQVHCISALSM